MSQGLSEKVIIQALADVTAKRITRRVIASLQRMHHTLSGGDSELETTWDEICIQVQYGESFFWEAYDKTVHSLVDDYVAELPYHEKAALWLGTDVGLNWRSEPEHEREGDPVSNHDVVDYLVGEYVYAQAGR